MKFPRSVRSSGAACVVAVSLLLSPVSAQQPPARKPPAAPAPRTPAAPAVNAANAASEKAPVATLDTLLSADAYGIYAEMRMVGRQAASQELTHLIEPLSLDGTGAPDELMRLYEFVKAHAEELTTARLMLGAMPVRAGLPDAVVALEMPSAEEARKFLPELKEFIAASVAPKPQPGGETATTGGAATPDEPAANVSGRGRGRRRARGRATVENARADAAKPPAAPPIQVKRSGSIIAVSDQAFTFKGLRGNDQPLLFNEPGFQAARTRFSNDELFIYFNPVRMTQSSKMQSEALEREYQRQEKLAEEARRQKAGSEANYNSLTIREAMGDAANANANNSNVAVAASGNTNSATNANVPPMTPEEEEELRAALAAVSPEPTPSPKSEKELEEERKREQSRQFAQTMASLVFGEGPGAMASSSAWPESIGVGVSLEAESLVVRGLFVNLTDDQPLRPVPFLPVVLSGPSIAAEAPNILPAETDVFVTMSLDLPQMYDYLASMIKILDLAAASGEGKGGIGEQLTSFEKTNNFRIREELLAALGNEIAIGMPSHSLGLRSRSRKAAEAEGTAPSTPITGPIAVIALNDKKALQELLPRVLAAVGFAGATEQNIIEKYGDVEVLNFSNGTFAFIDRFLVSAPDAASMRRVADAYNKGETLVNDERFRDSTHWQARQAVGQIYVSSAMLKGMFEDITKAADDIDDEAVRAYLTRLDPEPGAITHSATREPNGLMHEIHLPKNLLSLFVGSSLVSQKLMTLRTNEAMAQWKLRIIQNAQQEYKESTGRFGTLEELKAAGHFNEEHEALETEGYEIKLSASGDKFEATATPTGYPKLGRRSFYISATSEVRGSDNGGKPASASDPVVDY